MMLTHSCPTGRILLASAELAHVQLVLACTCPGCFPLWLFPFGPLPDSDTYPKFLNSTIPFS